MKYRNKKTGEIVKAFNHYQSAETDWPKWGKERIRIINKVDPEFEWIVLRENKYMDYYGPKEFIETFDKSKGIMKPKKFLKASLKLARAKFPDVEFEYSGHKKHLIRITRHEHEHNRDVNEFVALIVTVFHDQYPEGNLTIYQTIKS